jgi:Leucine-rich repeat (LRR) protein
MKEQEVIKSNPARRRYRIASVIMVVSFIGIFVFVPYLFKSMYPGSSDIDIRRTAAKMLNKTPDELTNADFKQIIRLDLSGKKLTDIRLIRKFKNLQELNLSDLPDTAKPKPIWRAFLEKLHILKPRSYTINWSGGTSIGRGPGPLTIASLDKNSIDLSPVRKLFELRKLDLSRTDFKNIKSLKNLDNLTELNLAGTAFSDLKQIKGLKNLHILNLGGTEISDLEPIKAHTNVRQLSLSSTAIEDFSHLRTLTNLEVLHLGQTNITELSSIEELVNLKELDIGYSNIADIEPIKGLTKLEVLNLGTTQVSDLVPLKGLINLKKLVLNGTQVSDIESIKELAKLQELVLFDTEVSDLEPIKNLSNLKSLWLGMDVEEQQINDLKTALPNLKIHQ